MQDSLQPVVTPLAPEHLSEVVRVHMLSFPTSATTVLGKETVRRYYEWQFVGPHQAHYLAVWLKPGQLGGFCFCGRFKGALGGFLTKNRPFLIRQFLLRPWVLRHQEVRSAARDSLSRFIPKAFAPRPPQPPAAPADRAEPARFGILAIAVDPAARRKGFAAALMARAEEIARQTGFQKLELSVRPSNEAAVRFYRTLGWEEILDDGVWCGRMQKTLVNLT